MSKRLQVLIPEEEYKKLKQHAKLERLTLGAWVRSALRRITESESARSPEEKLKAVKHALKIGAPTDNIDDMKKQIESGYLK